MFRHSLEQYDTPRPQQCHYDAPPSNRPLYDYPKPQQPLYQIPTIPNNANSQNITNSTNRSLIIGIRGGQPSKSTNNTNISNEICANKNEFRGGVALQHQEYDVPKSVLSHQPLIDNSNNEGGDRNSKVSLMSCDSNSTQVSAESLSSASTNGEGEVSSNSNRSSLETQEVYDIPPEPRKITTSPKPPQLPPRTYQSTPPRSQLKNIPLEVVYDIPPQVSRDTRCSDVAVDNLIKRLSTSSTDSTSQENVTGLKFKQLLLEYNSAKDTLSKMEQEVIKAAEKVACLKGKTGGDNDKTADIKVSVYKLKEILNEFIDFARGCIGNSFKNGDSKIAQKISKLLDPIESSCIVTNDAWKRLETLPAAPTLASKAIAIEQLKQVSSITTLLSENCKHLSSIIQTNANIVFKKSPTIETALLKSTSSPKEVILTAKSNDNDKFSSDDDKTPVQERPLPELPKIDERNRWEPKYKNESNTDPHSWIEDYDYVRLESTKADDSREHREIMDVLPTSLRQSYDNLVKQSQVGVDSDHSKAITNTLQHNIRNNDNINKLSSDNDSKKLSTTTIKMNQLSIDSNDKQLIHFYGAQCKLHLQNLNQAIDAFLLTIENNQPPRIFIAHSKFVILSAHKLVYIGDTVYRNVKNMEIKTHLLNCTNALCDAMKTSVTTAKNAALQFPSVVAVQEMVDSFVSISHLSNNLKIAVCRV